VRLLEFGKLPNLLDQPFLFARPRHPVTDSLLRVPGIAGHTTPRQQGSGCGRLRLHDMPYIVLLPRIVS
jgi:hypothetical protein